MCIRDRCEEALTAVFAQIERQESSLHWYVTLEKEKALKQAREIQKKIDEGQLEMCIRDRIKGVPDEESRVERILKPELIVRESCMKREAGGI